MKQFNKFTYYEFFAGGGMARAGLGENWHCLFANDFDEKKAEIYSRNWGKEHLHVKDVRTLTSADLPGEANLAWASFPCQDLSLAGAGGGLDSERSGSFWPFWRLMRDLGSEKRNPAIILLENVYGAITSHGGKDFSAICSALSEIGYNVGAVTIDAAHFVPQSRTRLFIIAVRRDQNIPHHLIAHDPNPLWHPKTLLKTGQQLAKKVKDNWIWWNIPTPTPRQFNLIDILEEKPSSVNWKSDEDTQLLLEMMTETNRKKVIMAQSVGHRMVGGLYRRTRNGVQRAEVRFDNISGCLRTPSGGSSRQLLLPKSCKQF